jgi:hypothetical protein
MAAMEGALVCLISGAGDSDSEPTVRESASTPGRDGSAAQGIRLT